MGLVAEYLVFFVDIIMVVSKTIMKLLSKKKNKGLIIYKEKVESDVFKDFSQGGESNECGEIDIEVEKEGEKSENPAKSPLPKKSTSWFDFDEDAEEDEKFDESLEQNLNNSSSKSLFKDNLQFNELLPEELKHADLKSEQQSQAFLLPFDPFEAFGTKKGRDKQTESDHISRVGKVNMNDDSLALKPAKTHQEVSKSQQDRKSDKKNKKETMDSLKGQEFSSKIRNPFRYF